MTTVPIRHRKTSLSVKAELTNDKKYSLAILKAQTKIEIKVVPVMLGVALST